MSATSHSATASATSQPPTAIHDVRLDSADPAARDAALQAIRYELEDMPLRALFLYRTDNSIHPRVLSLVYAELWRRRYRLLGRRQQRMHARRAAAATAQLRNRPPRREEI